MIYSVQYLRGIAALMVVLHHIAIKGSQYDISALNYFHVGYFGVDLFFIISGYIMCHTTANKKITFSKFMGARISRIMPLYWVVTSLAFIIFIVKPDIVNSGGGTTSVWASYILAPTGDRFLVDNGWTLSYEFFFYFIFGCTLMLKTENRGFIIGCIIWMLVAVGLYIHPETSWGKFSTNVLLLEFLMGICAFNILRRNNINNTIAIILIITGLTILIAENSLGTITTPFHRAISGGVPMLMIFLGMVSFEKKLMKNKNIILNFTEKLGNSSYSLYLIHPFILSPAAIVSKKMGITDYPWIFTSILLLGAIIAGWICYLYIETPLTKIVKKHLERRISIKVG
ncbi:hypothetical protein ED28_14830 [[Pantoea] beijingensis]|uniref:Acyltransferase 3 domain-containing protein n=2 Tax=[Pantoea] beijingensis TaxID=1324864 RepID=A0A443IAW5_9GAMM|nr:acyltransferase [[Pantoea] beijingensis]RWR01193.1 hypothetical protein ED28_14830 [[Pantoea] beijingensis]